MRAFALAVAAPFALATGVLIAARSERTRRARERGGRDGGVARSAQERLVRLAEERVELLEAYAAELDALLAFAPVGLAFFDRAGRYVRVNDQLAAINGLPAEAHVGKTIRELLPSLADASEPVLQRALETGEAMAAREFVGETPRSPGERRSFLAGFFPVRGAAGAIISAGCVVMEITELRRAEEAIRESEGKFRAVFDSDVVPLQIARTDGLITEANDAFLRLVGLTRDELARGEIWFTDLTPAEWRPLDERLVEQLAKTGRFGPLEKEYRLRDGRRVPVLIGGSALPGHRDYGVAFILDLTEQKRARAALEEQLLLTRTITDNATAGLFLVDGAGRCTFANPAARAMTGFTFDELRERPLDDLLRGGPAEPPSPGPDSLFAKAFEERPGHAWEDVLLRKNGERFPAACTATPISCEGRPLMAVIEVRDLTEQKRIERERESLLESERSARGEAERASRMKDEFVATVSHELRTPLSAIMGWAHILQRPGTKADQVANGLVVIERNARLQAKLVSDLLDASRIVSGKMHVDLAPVDLSQAVDAALDELRGAAEKKGVDLHGAVSQRGALVLGDPGRLAQIVSNLVSNAIKFTPKGGRVTVDLARAGARLVLSVSDTGMGIAPDFLPHVFDRFRQADASSTRSFAGLGLGLSLVRHLVELHHGSVRAESAGIGQGARFVVELPVVEAAAEVAPGPGAWRGASDLSGAKVLVVDDEPDTRDILVRVLEESGASVVAAPSAQRALELIDAERPDVLVSDIGMPGMDGYELVRRIRAMWTSPVKDVPAIALTAFARGEDRAHALGAGFQAHMAKPIEPLAVVDAIARLLPRSDRSGMAA